MIPLNPAIDELNILMDTVLIVLPVPPLARLQMEWSRELATMDAFGADTM